MSDFFKKKIKKEKERIEDAYMRSDIPVVHEKSQAERLADAKVNLEKARDINRKVIETELRNIRHDRLEHLPAESSAQATVRLKKAYYSINLIDSIEADLNAMSTEHELFAAQNKLTKALKIINRMDQKAEKPKEGRFERKLKQYENAAEDRNAEVEEMYQSIQDIDEYVSDELVEKLINNESVENCLKRGDGVLVMPRVALDDLDNFRYEDMDASELGNV